MARPAAVHPRTTNALTKRQEGEVRARAMKKVSTIVNRMTAYATGEPYVDRDGKVIEEKVEMTSGELRAAEILLRKTLPDLTAVQVVDDDPVKGMGRDEIIDMIGGLIASNPRLAQLAGIQHAVDESKTVADVVPIELGEYAAPDGQTVVDNGVTCKTVDKDD